MSTKMSITIDCTDPVRLAEFWAFALGYVPQPPPEGFPDWNSYWRSCGVPADELGDTYDVLVDPDGVQPRVWFQPVPEPKQVKNRLHLDLAVSGGRDIPLAQRRERVLAREAELVAAGARRLYVLESEGVDHFGVVMADPEGNEFCLN